MMRRRFASFLCLSSSNSLLIVHRVSAYHSRLVVPMGPLRPRSLSLSSSCSSSASDDSDKRIQLPVLQYGYRTVPLDWPELVQIILIEKCLAKLSRSVEQQRDYEIYRRDLKRHWKSIYDHILVTKFGREQRTDPKDGLYYAYPPLSSDIKEVKKCVVHNDFPYYMADGVEHWVLWKLGADCTLNDIDDAKQEIGERLGDVVDFMHWVNPPHLKSLPDIDHVHILCRRETTPNVVGIEDGKSSS